MFGGLTDVDDEGLRSESWAVFSEVVDPLPVWPITGARPVVVPHASVAAFVAGGARGLRLAGILEGAALPPFPPLGRNDVRNILPFFSGLGVREVRFGGTLRESTDEAGPSLSICGTLFERGAPYPELSFDGNGGLGGNVGRLRSV